MDMKNALAVCLISFFSATLVVLIARALDLQAAGQVESQLAAIVEELQAIRKQGGIAAPVGAVDLPAVDDGLKVYYFHGNQRCPTCESIQSQTHETVRTDFASQLASGEVVWKILNYDKPAGKKLAEKFKVSGPVVVLVRMKDGEVEDSNRLDRVWTLVGNKRAFAEYIRDEIGKMHEAMAESPPDESNGDVLDIPLPEGDPAEIPVPGAPEDIPIPE